MYSVSVKSLKANRLFIKVFLWNKKRFHNGNVLEQCDKIKESLLNNKNQNVDDNKNSNETSDLIYEDDSITTLFPPDKETVLKSVAAEKARETAAACKLRKEYESLRCKKLRYSPVTVKTVADIEFDRNVNWGVARVERVIDKKENPKDYKEITFCHPETTKKSGSGDNDDGFTGVKSRPVRGEPGAVIFGFIPIEWQHFLVPKTGVSGFYTLLFTAGVYLISKEIYVLEHNFYGGLSLAIMWTYGVKSIGPDLAKYLDKEIDKYENKWKEQRALVKQTYEDFIKDEDRQVWQAEGQHLLLAAKRFNVKVQLEEEFRRRQMQVYEQVTRQMDYFVHVAFIKRRLKHKNLIEYVHNAVKKAITPEMQQSIIMYSIDEIAKTLQTKDKP